jgi:ribosomal protein S18 acetylase RimI-like enzyme
MDSVEIVPFRPQYRSAFERLNRVWLEGHKLLEDADLEYLQDPEGHILDGGGEVFFAVRGGAVIGTCAAIVAGPDTVELAKLSVDPAAKGAGLGRLLCERVLRFARERGARRVVLTSQHGLTTAIRLYESLGFQHAPMPATNRYETADVYMTLDLTS